MRGFHLVWKALIHENIYSTLSPQIHPITMYIHESESYLISLVESNPNLQANYPNLSSQINQLVCFKVTFMSLYDPIQFLSNALRLMYGFESYYCAPPI